jgi:hypothetical protein
MVGWRGAACSSRALQATPLQCSNAPPNAGTPNPGTPERRTPNAAGRQKERILEKDSHWAVNDGLYGVPIELKLK